MKLSLQSKVRKDSLVAEFYHQAKVSGLNVYIAYRDYAIQRGIIDAVIYNNSADIICFVLIHKGVHKFDPTGLAGMPTFYISTVSHIYKVINSIKELIQ